MRRFTMLRTNGSIRIAYLLCVAMIVVPTFAGDEEHDAFVVPEGLAEGWYARIETSRGRIIARLLPEQAPQSVAHFAGLAQGTLEWFDYTTGELKKGPYYDGIRVHLVEAGQRFEAGDPRGTGEGAPEMLVPPEFGPIDFSRPGRLGMTRSSGRVSGVLFFATAAAMPWLNRAHPCFGDVVSGRKVIVNISQVKSYPNGRPIDPPEIEKIRIFSVGEPAPLPEPEPYYPERLRFEADSDK